jgi:hypothetical protein
MAIPNQSLFEAPAAHETHYSNPYSNPEFEDEWEATHEATHYSNPYSNPEMESEWETPEATHYSNPYSNPEFENEWEATHEATHHSNPYSNPEMESEWEATHEATHYSNPYSNPEMENEWETPEATHYSNPYSNPEMESEWETHEAMPYSNPYSNPEWEDEGEYFFKKAFRSIGRGIKAVAKAAAPLAKRFAPILAGKLASLIPGVGLIAGPLAAKLTSALVQEGEMESVQMEAEFFGTNEAEAEVSHTETAHEAALTEFLAAQAAEATTEAEAEAALGASLPITITIMGGRRALRRVMPILNQANSQLVKNLAQQGPVGRQLLRTVPAIQRQTVATLKAAARSGRPINGPLAVRAMVAATRRVLGNPQRVQRTMVRNAVLRQRTAPPNPRRAAAGVGMNGRCPACASRVAPRMVSPRMVR